MHPVGQWTFTAHACRLCLGRVVQQGQVFRCADCGRTGNQPMAVCGCGLIPEGHKKPIDGGYRCGPNPHVTAREPAEIIIFFGDMPIKPELA